MATKTCTACKMERGAEEFLTKANKSTKTCKKCRERGLRSRNKNKDVRKERTKKWKESNKDRIKEYNKSYRTGTNWSEIKTEKGIKDKTPQTRRKDHVLIEGIEHKTCSKCKGVRKLEEYTKYSNSWDGLRTTCNTCLHSYRMERKPQMTEYNKNYWKETKESQTIKHKEWRQNNLEHLRKYQREYVKKWGKNQRDTNPQHKLSRNLRCRLWCALRDQNVEKKFHTFDLIGCSPAFLRGYIEAKFQPGMNWDNYGPDGWHIDHIRPCASFDLTDPEQQKECFHYTNLQPLWASENISKGYKWTPEVVIVYELNFVGSSTED